MRSKAYLIHILVTKQSMKVDASNIIEYNLPQGIIRDIKWVKHYKQYFLLGLIIEDQLKTRL